MCQHAPLELARGPSGDYVAPSRQSINSSNRHFSICWHSDIKGCSWLADVADNRGSALAF